MPDGDRWRGGVADRDRILARLEEHYILDEISVDTYKSLRVKYRGE